MKIRARAFWVGVFHVSLALALLPVLSGCEKNKTKMLGIVGYNYTAHYITSFDVGGQGGGDVDLSDDRDGGGKTSCCMGYSPDTSLPVKMKVTWTFGYERDAGGKIVFPDETHEAIAELNGPVPEDPQQLEVHFMPDGTVKLRITREYSPPLVIVKRSEELLRQRAQDSARQRALGDALAKAREEAIAAHRAASAP